jgi:RNA polymerase sigma factor (sigma-70 family)
MNKSSSEQADPAIWVDEHGDALFRYALSRLRDWEVRPDQLLQRKEFSNVLNGCIEKLPAKPGGAFCLREMENQSTEEICKVLAVTPTHLWVLLHRARLRLQACLDQNWFNTAPKET